ncbi:sugar O-acetyltransferase [Loigolactobacillus jiayinensis]|uniref:Acetyltransferase n=1 Tax=Loigolactobacillus jiayinensis TaxID=2486016 RepID=A0ABW1RDG5_9LACO|nr:sugar O-acetyltransferase [Loigolactobacillus jiayinensis]
MSTDYDLMTTGQLYDSTAAELVQLRATTKQLVFRYNRSAPEQSALRQELLAQLIDCPSGDAYFKPSLQVDYGHHVHVGRQFYANADCILLDVAPINIGDNVMLGPRVSLYTAGHPLVASVRNQYLEFGQPITLADNVWLGGNVVVCPGVTIGANTVVGAGAVVTKNLPANVVAAGNPARIVRSLTAADEAYWQAQRQQYLAARA